MAERQGIDATLIQRPPTKAKRLRKAKALGSSERRRRYIESSSSSESREDEDYPEEALDGDRSTSEVSSMCLGSEDLDDAISTDKESDVDWLDVNRPDRFRPSQGEVALDRAGRIKGQKSYGHYAAQVKGEEDEVPITDDDYEEDDEDYEADLDSEDEASSDGDAGSTFDEDGSGVADDDLDSTIRDGKEFQVLEDLRAEGAGERAKEEKLRKARQAERERARKEEAEKAKKDKKAKKKAKEVTKTKPNKKVAKPEPSKTARKTKK